MDRIMGIDFGLKRIGIAISDPAGTMAHPLAVIHRETMAKDMERIAAIAAEYTISKIVLGLPLNMDGTPGRLTQEVTSFANRLKKDLALPVELLDERLTSYGADCVMIEQADLSRQKRINNRDKIAAALILEAYLSRSA
ncbi:MAG: Holliday junction resolvase RuvX [Elusimicrobia bacterium]|nr:Holliday junction resolvase RuvX [Elusimicrobiota bacterium]